ncbi:MAG: RsmE family RNA methyltransferase [Vulcanimicrobiaceae bacterium]
MSAPRFFVEGTHAPGDTVAFHGADAHKIANVLRLREGDAIDVIDSAANVFTAVLSPADSIEERRSVRAILGELRSAGIEPRTLRVTIAQGIPKGQKMDFIVEKLTELGVAQIVPFESERSVVVGSSANKVERWRRLAKTAAQQCGRLDVPEISHPIGFAELLSRFASFDCVLFPWELAGSAPLRQTLPPLIEGARRVLVTIGPEGGFSHAEADAAKAAGAHVISLGSRILRTETAGIALLAVLDYLTQG